MILVISIDMNRDDCQNICLPSWKNKGKANLRLPGAASVFIIAFQNSGISVYDC